MLAIPYHDQFTVRRQGEATETERILKGFAERFHEQTPTLVSAAMRVDRERNPDSVSQVVPTGEAVTTTPTPTTPDSVAPAVPAGETVDSVDNVFVLCTSAIMLNGTVPSTSFCAASRQRCYLRSCQSCCSLVALLEYRVLIGALWTVL